MTIPSHSEAQSATEESLRRELAASQAEARALRAQLEAITGLGARLESLQRELGEPTSSTDGPYLVFATVGGSYEVVEAAGPLPAPGATVEVHGTTQLVLRHGPSPLAGSALPCVYTIPV